MGIALSFAWYHLWEFSEYTDRYRYKRIHNHDTTWSFTHIGWTDPICEQYVQGWRASAAISIMCITSCVEISPDYNIQHNVTKVATCISHQGFVLWHSSKLHNTSIYFTSMQRECSNTYNPNQWLQLHNSNVIVVTWVKLLNWNPDAHNHCYDLS